MSSFVSPDAVNPDSTEDEEQERSSWDRRRFLLRAARAAVAGGVLATMAEGTRSILVPGRDGFGVAGASPSSGVARSGIGRGGVTRGGQLEIKEGTDVAMDLVKVEPGGASGWHTHPGPEVLLVTKGVLTFRRASGLTCVTEQVSAGHAFMGASAGEHHAAFNNGSEPVEIIVVFFNVPTGAPTRAEADAPVLCV